MICQWLPVISSQIDKVILSQSDWYVTDGILKTEKAYLPTILSYCITKIKALTENCSHKAILQSQSCLTLTLTLWQNHFVTRSLVTMSGASLLMVAWWQHRPSSNHRVVKEL